MTISRTSARFLSVGLICAVAHNAIVIAASLAHIHYAVACLISYVVVVALGFALHARFTFEVPPTFAAFSRYAISMAANYPITLALLFLMSDVARWPVAIAAPVATVLLFVWNFASSRWAIADKPQSPPSASQAFASQPLPPSSRQA